MQVAHTAHRVQDAAAQVAGLTGAGTAPDGLPHQRPVFRHHQGIGFLQRHFRTSGVGAIDHQRLRRRHEGAPAQVHGPASHVADALRLEHLVLHLLQRLFVPMAFGHVLDGGEQLPDLSALVTDRAHVNFGVHHAPVLAHEALGHAVAAALPGDQLVEQRHVALQVARRRHLGPVLAQELLARVTEDLAQLVVDLHPALVGRRRDRHAQEGQFVEHAQQLGLLPLGLLGLLLCADVQQDAADPHHLAEFVALIAGVVVHPGGGTIGPEDPVFLVVLVRPVLQETVHLGPDPPGVVRVQQRHERHAPHHQRVRVVAPLADVVVDIVHRPARRQTPLDHHQRRTVDQLAQVQGHGPVGLQLAGHVVGGASDQRQFILPGQPRARREVACAHVFQGRDQLLGPPEPDQVQQQRQQGRHTQRGQRLDGQFPLRLLPALRQRDGDVHQHAQTVSVQQRHPAGQQRGLPNHRDVDPGAHRPVEKRPQALALVDLRERLVQRPPDVGPRQRGQHHVLGTDEIGVVHAIVQAQRAHDPAQHQRVGHAHAHVETVLVNAQAVSQPLGFDHLHFGCHAPHLVLVPDADRQQGHQKDQQGHQPAAGHAQQTMAQRRHHGCALSRACRRSAQPSSSSRAQSGGVLIRPIRPRVVARLSDCRPSARGRPDMSAWPS